MKYTEHDCVPQKLEYIIFIHTLKNMKTTKLDKRKNQGKIYNVNACPFKPSSFKTDMEFLLMNWR